MSFAGGANRRKSAVPKTANNSGELVKWKEQSISEFSSREENIQELAILQMKCFIKSFVMAVRIQSWYRMVRSRRPFHQYHVERLLTKGILFQGWKILTRAEHMSRRRRTGIPFFEWRNEKRLRRQADYCTSRFFQISINTLQINAFSCWSFFNYASVQCDGVRAITLSSLLHERVRRLILRKIYNTWSYETRRIKTLRFSARRILNRTSNRTSNPKWRMEICTNVFQMWRRYTATKVAFRSGKIAPLFSPPEFVYLDAWFKLRTALMIKQVKCIDALKKYKMLLQMRAWRLWKKEVVGLIGSVEQFSKVSLAIEHYEHTLVFNVLWAWNSVARNHRKDYQRLKRTYLAWGGWARVHRRDVQMKADCALLMRMRRQSKAFKIMAAITFSITQR